MINSAPDPRHSLLVVDDAPENIDILCDILQPFYRVKVATNGQKALAIVMSEQPPDLVLTDVVMPGMDGFELCRRIKACAGRQHIPILFVTSLDQTEDEAKALDTGAADYITKPFSPTVVLARVRTHLALFEYTTALEHKVQERTAALSANEERLRLAVAAGNLGIFDIDVRSGDIEVSPEYVRILGYDPATFKGTIQGWLERMHPEDVEKTRPLRLSLMTGSADEYSFEARQRSQSGDWLWILSIGRVVERDAQGRALRVLGIHTDITPRKTMEIRLQQASLVFTHARESIFITDDQGVLLEVNDAFTRMTGYSREEAVGQRGVDLLYSGRHSDEFYTRRHQILAETGQWVGEVWNRRKNGELFASMVTVNQLRNSAGALQNNIVFATDLTDDKAHQNQLEQVAHYDALTSLPNRTLLTDRLHQAMAHCRRQQQQLAVVLLDLDGFKAVNDQHGHDVGDNLLIALSQRMSATLRHGDTLARVGGDEFVAVLVGLNDEQDCEMLLQRLLQAAAETVTVKEVTLRVSASMGVTLFPQDDSDIDMLMRHADQAMYVAKQSGKNRYHLFDIAQDKAVKTQRETLEHIHQALENHEFVLYYQPKVNMRTGEVIGAEALIRWQHPRRGLLSPGLFLPVIEGHPISINLGEWVIGEALAQMARWHADGLDIGVSVNIGALQLQQRNFTARLRELLDAHPTVNPGSLELEILETSALADISWVSEVMRACQTLGVRFALDDFGTGYSSLSYLKRLPAEMLKIDQSFVRDMLNDPDDLSIVQTVISLAAAFRRSVIAEGVETIAHGTALIAMNCELAQGYGIARPMPAGDFRAWEANWRPDPAWITD